MESRSAVWVFGISRRQYSEFLNFLEQDASLKVIFDPPPPVWGGRDSLVSFKGTSVFVEFSRVAFMSAGGPFSDPMGGLEFDNGIISETCGEELKLGIGGGNVRGGSKDAAGIIRFRCPSTS